MIILTGASGGIGKCLIHSLAELDDVIGIYNKTIPEETHESNIKYVKLDLRNSEDVIKFSKENQYNLKNLTILNFAVMSVDGLAANYEETDWDATIGINLKSNFLLAKSLIPTMINDNFGRIIHISSVVGQDGIPGTIAYAASKTGLLGLSRVFAREYARFNITSNVLILGYFNVGLFTKLKEDQQKEIINQIPSKKLGDVSNILYAIKFIINSEYVNGSVINIDGGI